MKRLCMWLHGLVQYLHFLPLLSPALKPTSNEYWRIPRCRRIGYMMFALGVSGYGGENGLGYTASMFHLFTHAFFKSLLFLCAGAVIHIMHSNDMKDMGGLRKFMPITNIAFLIACLAIAGIPPFAGFSARKKF